MSAGRHSFKHNDAARLIRATTAAGLKVKSVTLEKGKVRLETDDAGANREPETDTNEWDERIKQNANDKKRTS
jgi:hypothetical protein